MDSQGAIRLLNEDIRGEHGAIILYLRIAYALGEGELAADIEEIARDEMRHFKWLSEEVARLGGSPTVEREEAPAGPDDVPGMVRHAIASEESAVGQYEAHAQAVGDARIAGLLRRIALDERLHHQEFQDILEVLQRHDLPEEEAPELPVPVVPPPEAIESLQGDIHLEYTTLLHYLEQSFITPDCILSKDLLDQAIIEMKHMGWLAEHIAEAGVTPRLEHGPVAAEGDPQQLLRADVATEVAVEEAYRRQIDETDDPKLRALLQLVLDHSAYHEAHFRELLAERQAPAAPEPEASEAPGRTGSGWTVGSLLGRPQ